MTAERDEDVQQYEGYPIIDTAWIINKTGDGLSDAVHVEPISVAPDEQIHAVIRLKKTKDRYDFVRDSKSGVILGVKWIQVFDCTGAAPSDAKTSIAAVAQMVEKVAKAKAEAKGQLGLNLEGLDDDPEDNISHLPTAKRARDKEKEIADKVDDAMGGKQ